MSKSKDALSIDKHGAVDFIGYRESEVPENKDRAHRNISDKLLFLLAAMLKVLCQIWGPYYVFRLRKMDARSESAIDTPALAIAFFRHQETDHRLA